MHLLSATVCCKKKSDIQFTTTAYSLGRDIHPIWAYMQTMFHMANKQEHDTLHQQMLNHL